MYESFFGLKARPFQLSPDPDFYFGSRGHRRAMAYLQYGLHQGEGFIVVTGEVGAGKTTLLAGLLRTVSRDSIEAAQIVSTQVDADDLLRMVAGAFGVASDRADKSAQLTALSDHFKSLHAQGKRALLIVDEAQNLSPNAVEELRMLSNFQTGNRPMLQSFLVGQPEFRAIMQRAEMQQLKQRVIASYHLGPLDELETISYVEHRMRVAGWRNDPSFEPGAMTAIFAASGGVPRRINTLCDRVLLAAYLAETHRITATEVNGVAAEIRDELDGAAPRAEAPRQAGATAPAAGVAPSELRQELAALANRVAALEGANAMLRSLLVDVMSRTATPRPSDAEAGS